MEKRRRNVLDQQEKVILQVIQAINMRNNGNFYFPSIHLYLLL